MIAYKFLGHGALGRFSRFRWPAPSELGPGAWVAAVPPLRPCARGIHACRMGDLAHWLDHELWRIELAGELLEASSMVVGERGRLVQRVSAWEAELGRDFAAHCAAQARAIAERAAREQRPRAQLAEQFAADVELFAARGELATAAYVSAVAAHIVSDQAPEAAYADERAAQSAWLADRLSLA